MVQFFDRPESTREKFLGGFAKTFGPSVLDALGSYERKKMMESENRALGLPEEVRDPRIREKLLERKQEEKDLDISKDLKDLGFKDEEADVLARLYKKSPQGGRTQIISNLMEKGERGELKQEEPKAQVIESPYNPEIFGDQKLEFQELPKDTGRTAAERVRREDKREQENSKVYQTLDKTLTSLESQERDLESLTRLNQTGKVAEGTQVWKINPKTGDLFIPAATNPETQLYAKILNGFIKNAKEFFPGRVTNFDLQSFKQILPGLSNSKEGREQIIKYMDLTNRIAHLKEDTLRRVYDHYGVNQIDSATARKIANENYNKMKPVLENELKNMTSVMENSAKNLKEKSHFKPPFKPGTAISPEVVKWYKANYGDKEVAKKKMMEDGIEF